MKKTVAILLVLVMVLALCACGGGSAAGTWKLTGLFEGDTDYSAYLALLGDVTLVLNDDGTGTMEMYGQKAELTWDDANITMEGEAAPYTLDGDTLTMESDGSRLVFTRK